jgi:hypothetical protein
MIGFPRFGWVSVFVWISPARSADFSAARVRVIVAAATADKPADLSGKSLENLDLSNLDFRRANPSGAKCDRYAGSGQRHPSDVWRCHGPATSPSRESSDTLAGGTEGSNPSRSSGESSAN